MTAKKKKADLKKVGRKTVMTESVLAKLESCFAKGYNDYEAYNSAGISKDAFYRYKDAHPAFSEKVEWLKNNTRIISKEIVYDKLVDKDILTAKWLLERKAKDEFSTKQELDLGESGNFNLVFKEGDSIVVK